MSHQRDEEFDSIYASIDDDDDEIDEMYVDVSSTSPFTSSGSGDPSPYVDPNLSPPPGRKLPPIPGKSAAGAGSKAPWPRPAPQPPSNLSSYKSYASTRTATQDRSVPLPLPRTATAKKKGVKKPAVKSRQQMPKHSTTSSGYNPPSTSGNSQAQGKRVATPRYQDTPTKTSDSGIEEDTRYRHGIDRNPPLAARKVPNPPPFNTPPPPPHAGQAVSGRGTGGGANFPESGHVLTASTEDDNADYESLRPARQRLRRGYGQQSRRSRRYSDEIPLQEFPSDDENGRQRKKRGRYDEDEEDRTSRHKSDNSAVVCILLTITVIALLIALMSLAASVYTLTRFEIYRRSNDTCDVVVDNCRADLSLVLCPEGSGNNNTETSSICETDQEDLRQIPVHCDITKTQCN